LIFVEACSRRIIEGEMRGNNRSHREEQAKKLQGGSVEKVLEERGALKMGRERSGRFYTYSK
jgi:hypothetical protein